MSGVVGRVALMGSVPRSIGASAPRGTCLTFALTALRILREATELRVQLRQGSREVIVPHLVVRRASGGWIIERIDVGPLTQGSRSGTAGILR